MEKNLSFEQALSDLEKIVNTLESGECSLDDAIKLYSTGAEKAKYCSKLLENAKLKIKTLSDAEAEANEQL